MYREHTVGVVIPAYNEEGLISEVINQMPEYVDKMYVVDDCSTDGTWNEIIATARENQYIEDSNPSKIITADGGKSMLDKRAILDEPIGRVVPIQHRENLGAGGAIKTGYLAALRDGVDIVPTVDGDGQMDLDQLPKLLDPIVEGEADYAKGNRLLYREFRSDMPKFRFIGNSILTLLTKISSGYWKTMDPQNGYTAISNYALENVGIEGMYEYYGYCNDLLVKLNAKGMRVADVAIPAIYGEEESSINYRTYIQKVSGMLLRNFMWRLKIKYLVLDFHPLALFYLFGASTAGLGSFAGVWSLYSKFMLGNKLFVSASLSMMLFTIGCMFLMFAMLFDMQTNENLEVQIRE
ncbi:glycosyltransferase family 2 protein [Halogranum amylolyticum]